MYFKISFSVINSHFESFWSFIVKYLVVYWIVYICTSFPNKIKFKNKFVSGTTASTLEYPPTGLLQIVNPSKQSHSFINAAESTHVAKISKRSIFQSQSTAVSYILAIPKLIFGTVGTLIWNLSSAILDTIKVVLTTIVSVLENVLKILKIILAAIGALPKTIFYIFTNAFNLT